ncbi:hypothetical protein [Amycolatopsis sp. SID8362]|uniref:hypothetical protein n=1 Tax=Amycolatopsis sp. SID8362 TaxID=2690346 RepID=UPI00136A3514|nr:hypothetical protein [Amycolatopsis sp. SID8362]NBH05412.1 hypothetical protein [Amycolatopsis sp. SID8362]NED42112.1 hypothetical protein [Amycolatopsis sp. SID8362]
MISLQFWRDALPGPVYFTVLALAVLCYARILLHVFTTKLASAEAKGKRNFNGAVEPGAVEQLAKHLEQDHGQDSVSAEHLRQFAWSLLTPAAVRRRVTDEYTPDHRTLRKSVSMEFSFDRRFHPWSTPGHASPRGEGALVAITLPKKGQLYDHFGVTDAAGKPIPRLLQLEYRILVAKTLRALLRAAFAGAELTGECLRAERDALAEIVRFGLPEQGPDETDQEFQARQDDHLDHRRRVLERIGKLELPERGDHRFLRLAVELVAKLSLNYAVVVAIPGQGERYVVKYDYTLIPDLELGKVTGRRGLRSRLHFILGTRPVFLSVSARNAAYCQSYHLTINAASNLYVGDFDISAITDHVDAEGTAGARPRWRVRGRRGQHYFHLHTRSLKVLGKQGDPDQLRVTVKFFEVPPGSLGHAGIAALACLAILAAVTWTVAKAPNVDAIDTEIAAFLLAFPGLAAAWLGFETRSAHLFEGTLTARISSAVTFLLSLTSSVLLLLTTSHVVSRHPVHLFVFVAADWLWSLLVGCALLHAAAICAFWWQRATFYRRLAVRPVGSSGPRATS